MTVHGSAAGYSAHYRHGENPCDTESGLRTMQLSKLTGATFRQLDYWARTGIVVPMHDGIGSGIVRLWDEADVPKVRAMAAVSAVLSGPNSVLRVIGQTGGTGPWTCDLGGIQMTIALSLTDEADRCEQCDDPGFCRFCAGSGFDDIADYSCRECDGTGDCPWCIQ